MTLNFVLKICVNFFFPILLDLQQLFEHFILKHNHAFKFFMILFRVLLLFFERYNGQLVCFDNLIDLKNECISVSLSCAKIELLVINIIKISTTINFSKLKEQFEFLKIWQSDNTYYISQFHCCSLQITNHQHEHVKNTVPLNFLISGFLSKVLNIKY